jgi:hypothetical protein
MTDLKKHRLFGSQKISKIILPGAAKAGLTAVVANDLESVKYLVNKFIPDQEKILEGFDT